MKPRRSGQNAAAAAGLPARVRLRRAVNWLNLSTPIGLAVAAAGHGRIAAGPHGLLVAHGYRAWFPAPNAPAVTIGDVVLLRGDQELLQRRPRLLDHEARHATQYALWLGLPGFLPAYLIASAWSWWQTRDFALGNTFERRAGLQDGGYLPPAEPPLRAEPTPQVEPDRPEPERPGPPGG